MTTTPPTASLRLWRELLGAPEALRPGSRVVVRGSRGVCPPGWTGVLRLGDAIAVEAGAADDDALAHLLSLDDPSEPDQLTPLVRGDMPGPGELAYLPDRPVTRPLGAATADGANHIEEVASDAIAGWLATQSAEEVAESSAADVGRVLVLRRRGRIAGVAGWIEWPTRVAHLGVLTDPAHRGTGVATALGRAAVALALGEGLAPQWRAARWNTPSRAVAARIGLVEVGRQLSAERVSAPS